MNEQEKALVLWDYNFFFCSLFRWDYLEWHDHH